MKNSSKRIICFILAIALVSSLTVNVVFAENNFFEVNASQLCLRKGPTTSSEKIEVLKTNTVLLRLDDEAVKADGYTWYHVRNVSNGNEGYVASKHLSEAKTPDNYKVEDGTEETTYGYYKVTASQLNFRKEASTEAEVLSILKKDTVVVRVEKDEISVGDVVWYGVKEVGTSQKGYVMAQYLEETAYNDDETDIGGETSALAKRFEITANTLNLRKKATTSSSKVASLKKGDVVIRIDDSAAVADGYTWAHVRIEKSGEEGYLVAKYLKEIKEAETPVIKEIEEYYKVNSTKLNIRKEASTNSDKVVTIKTDAVVKRFDDSAIKKDGYTWYHIEVLESGEKGYAVSKYLELTSKPADAPDDVGDGTVVNPDDGDNTGKTPEAIAYYTVISNTLNIREEASTSSDQLTKLKKGDKIARIDDASIDADGYTWYHVYIEESKTEGYAASKYLTEFFESDDESDYYIVTATEACLRTGATTTAEIIEILVEKDVVIRLDETVAEANGYSWYHVRRKSTGSEGYIVSDFINEYSTEGVPGDTGKNTYYAITARELNFRKGPSTSTDIIETLRNGDIVELIGESISAEGYIWANVRCCDCKKEGYIINKYLKKTEFTGEYGVVYNDPETGRSYTTYNQGDDAWGFSSSVEQNACLISAYAMVLTNSGINATPKTVYRANNNSTGGNLDRIAKNIGVKLVCALSSDSPYLDEYESSGRTRVKNPEKNTEAAIKEAIDRNPEGVVLFFEKGSEGHAVVAVKYDEKGIIFCDSGRTNGSMIRWEDTWCKYGRNLSFADIDYIMAIDL